MRKIYLFIILVTTIILSFMGYMLTNSPAFGLCSINEYSCREPLNHIGDPLLYGMSALSLVFFLLLFVPQSFGAWKKFAVWFVPLATLLFIFYPDPGSGDLFSPYPEQVYRWVSTLYVIICSVIIFRNRKS